MKTSETLLANALRRFVRMVEDDKILVTSEHRAELIETLTIANKALDSHQMRFSAPTHGVEK